MSQNPGIGANSGALQPVSTKTALTALAPTVVSVGIISALAVAANASRKGLILINTSSNNISFGIGVNAAVLNSGITLTPNGVWDMAEYDYVTSAINAIASGAASNLCVQEFQ
jgi:hypothetical protein